MSQTFRSDRNFPQTHDIKMKQYIKPYSKGKHSNIKANTVYCIPELKRKKKRQVLYPSNVRKTPKTLYYAYVLHPRYAVAAFPLAGGTCSAHVTWL